MTSRFPEVLVLHVNRVLKHHGALHSAQVCTLRQLYRFRHQNAPERFGAPHDQFVGDRGEVAPQVSQMPSLRVLAALADQTLHVPVDAVLEPKPVDSRN